MDRAHLKEYLEGNNDKEKGDKKRRKEGKHRSKGVSRFQDYSQGRRPVKTSKTRGEKA